MLSVRELLECYSIQLASVLRTDDDLYNLEYLLTKQELIISGKRNNQQDFLNSDSEFHNLIAKIGKNEYLEKQLSQMYSISMRYLNGSTVEYIAPMALKEHWEIYEQIKNRDSEKAKQFMQKHMKNIRERIFEYLNVNG
jgi:DNA-binding GntR family transcriptional regulator